MPDWTKPMTQTYEFCIVDPNTWGDVSQLNEVTDCSINRDSGADTLGSASISTTETISETYIRVYMVTIQNGIKERIPLGTHLVQSPSLKYDGRMKYIGNVALPYMNSSMDCYTPLLELKDTKPPVGYTIPKGTNIMSTAYKIIKENCRAPISPVTCSETLYSDFTANPDEDWLKYVRDLIAMAKFHLELEPSGRIIFAQDYTLDELQPVWTYTDDNSSILLPEVSLARDLYGVPNTVEVIYTSGNTNNAFYSKIVNDDPDSPISTVNRGRTVLHRVINPDVPGKMDQVSLNDYATKLLKRLSSLEYTISYSHGYCPVRVGDCIRFDYKSIGLNNIKAIVKTQSIKCETGAEVQETATFTTKLWR